MPTLLFLHHPPIPVGSWIDPLGLKNRGEGEKILKKYDIRGCFAGHVHHEFEGQWGSIPVYTTPSTVYQIMGGTQEFRADPIPPGFRVIELKRDSFCTRVVRLPRLLYPPGRVKGPIRP